VTGDLGFTLGKRHRERKSRLWQGKVRRPGGEPQSWRLFIGRLFAYHKATFWFTRDAAPGVRPNLTVKFTANRRHIAKSTSR
jgi:hypothetical protein